MAAATGDGSGVAAIIAAAGGGVAGILGAIALLVRRREPEEAHDEEAHDGDPENRPARLRERLTALETRAHGFDARLEHHAEEIALLRAQEITMEGHVPRPPRRRGQS